MCSRNFLIDDFNFKGIMPGKAGQALIEYTFSIGNDGTMTVSAIDKHNKQNQLQKSMKQYSQDLNQDQLVEYEKKVEKGLQED